MEIKHIEKEISTLKTRLDLLNTRLKETQQKCSHHFIGNDFYEKCQKCHKVNVFYY